MSNLPSLTFFFFLIYLFSSLSLLFLFFSFFLFTSSSSSYRSKQGNLYTLETLLHYVNNHHVKHTEYIQNARTQGIPTVTFPDRKPLLDYLTGKISTTDSIEFVLPQNPKFPDLPLNDFPFSDHHQNDVAHHTPDHSFTDSKDLNQIEAPVDYMSLIYSSERPKDREELLECKGRNFYGVLTAATKREEERQRIESQQRKDGLVAKSRLMGSDDRGMAGYGDELGYDPTPKPKMHLKGGKIGEGVPIILVPSACPVQKKFSRDRDRVVTAYEVRDKPSALKTEDWDRVVAVFVLGKEWQFKDWPFKDHVEIFNKIMGFFMRFEDDSVESAKIVKQWNVKIISMSLLCC
ncbi:hypothetical protein ABKV19_026912 [Rosa sericea]